MWFVKAVACMVDVQFVETFSFLASIRKHANDKYLVDSEKGDDPINHRRDT